MYYTIKGKVTDKDGNNVRRRLFAYNREDGSLIDNTFSDAATGLYELKVYAANPVMVVCQPLSGETLNAIVFDNVTPIQVENDTPTGIGTPGSKGFGVGVAPDLPAGFSPMPGHTDVNSDNYGNYKYSDGSIMVWVPAFYYKWGTGVANNGIAVNSIDIKDSSAYASVAAANTAGYAMPRAFYDGGQLKKGFFIDKYLGSYDSPNKTLKSIPGRDYFIMDYQSYWEATPAYRSDATGYIEMARARGYGFFINSIFMITALQMLMYAHARASATTQNCKWHNPTYNFVKGNTNGTKDVFNTECRGMSSLGYTDRGVGQPSGAVALTGIYSDLAYTTHNGQRCGVAELVGGVQNMLLGFTSDGTNWYSLKKSVAMKDLRGTVDDAPMDAYSVTQMPTLYDSMGANIGNITTINDGLVRFLSKTTKCFSEIVDETNNAYRATNIGLSPYTNSYTTTLNYWWHGGMTPQYKSSQYVSIGGSNTNGDINTGIWTRHYAYSYSGGNFGARLGFYV